MASKKIKISEEIITKIGMQALDIKDQPMLLPSMLYLLPLTERPFFPPQTVPILIKENEWLSTLKSITNATLPLAGLVLVNKDNTDLLSPEDFNNTGTLIRVHHPVRSSQKIQFIAEGMQRFTITEWITQTAPFCVAVEYPQEALDDNIAQLKAYAMTIINLLKEMMPLNQLHSEELNFFLNRFSPSDPSPLADFAASLSTASKAELQDILGTTDLQQRMQKVLLILKKEVEMMKLQMHIRQTVEQKLSHQQRQFFLKEELKTIQKELGLSKNDKQLDEERFVARLENLTLPPVIQDRVINELNKLKLLESSSPEYAVCRNYLDIITDLPWGCVSKDNLDLSHAQDLLDKEHEGLEDIKERILEFIAVGALKNNIGGSIILLIGPPGVGKTSIGKSIATALNRAFYRFSVGGMRDEAEIKGHRRTYVGSMPGKIIQALKLSGTSNPVIMIDEIDKIGSSFQGDPASALLEVLDPEQNHEFLDHFLDCPYDLSSILFVCTANQLDTIPKPLLDRMEVMRLSGYTSEEKLDIAKRHLWPKQRERAGLSSKQIKINDTTLKAIIDGHAPESGVRNLEKQLSRITRKAALEIVRNPKTTLIVNPENLIDYLGHARYTHAKPLVGVGIVTGLAWTALGGATLDIEAACVQHRQRSLKLTGKLGEVMRESADIAYSYISSHLSDYADDAAYFDHRGIHLHVPEGATPKDGPSAGITIATALLSLARNQKLPRRLAMTGELTLTGHVLPVGGIREKIVAAKRVRLFELILPLACKYDYDELPDFIKKNLTVHFVKHYREVYQIIFGD